MPIAIAGKPRRAKGEQTRRQILAAALRVIAQQGYRALTHRAVAKEAAVNLSLTTYYFKDLGEMVAEAFRHHKDEVAKEVDIQWREIFKHLDQYDSEQLQQSSVRRDLIQYLSRTMTDYIQYQIEQRSQGIAVEMTFFFDLHLDAFQREQAYKLCSRFLDSFEHVCERLGSPDPQADAELILGTLHRLEYEAVAVPRLYNPEAVYRQTYRLLDALLGGVE